MLTGCESLTFSVDSLLKAPSVADEQAAIYQALIESVGRSVTLVYPRSGDFPSAFVVTDFDGDGGDEAMAFYTIPQQGGEQNVRVSVLDKDEDGWHAMYELSGRGSYIDTVLIADYGKIVDIVIGYGTPSFDESNLNIYRYSSGMLSPIYEDTYTLLDRLDIDSCGTKEIIIVRKIGTTVLTSVIKTNNGLEYDTLQRTLSTSASSIAGSCFGGLCDGINALFIDIADEYQNITTEAIYLGENGIMSPLSDSPELLRMTYRQGGYLSSDYDGDGTVEIPILTPFLGNASQNSSALYMTSWLAYNPNLGAFEVESASYYNVTDGFVFKLPSRWQNFVSAYHEDGRGEITFVKYDPDSQTHAEMPKLMSLAAVSPENEEVYISNGYVLITSNDFISIMIKSLAQQDEPLLLTQDEIRNNIFYIPS